jgi:hypothetical protein
MGIKRRDIIRVGALEGAVLVFPSAAWALSGSIVAPPKQILGALLGLAFDFLTLPGFGWLGSWV